MPEQVLVPEQVPGQALVPVLGLGLERALVRGLVPEREQEPFQARESLPFFLPFSVQWHLSSRRRRLRWWRRACRRCPRLSAFRRTRRMREEVRWRGSRGCVSWSCVFGDSRVNRLRHSRATCLDPGGEFPRYVGLRDRAGRSFRQSNFVLFYRAAASHRWGATPDTALPPVHLPLHPLSP